MTKLEDFLRPTQNQLFKRICKHFKGKTLVSRGNFVLVRGTAPIMLVAHLDTVHEQPVKDICATADGNILMSPQGIGGDDRCGVCALVKVHHTAQVKPWLLFTCDEEVGGIGAQVFADSFAQGRLPAEMDSLKCLIEIDRRGAKDAVFYDSYNPDFEDYITGKGFQTAFGSFSDISVIAPALGVAAVNLSAGYYNAHRLDEYIVRLELEHTIQKVIEIVADSTRADFPRFEYDTGGYHGGWWQEESITIPNDLPDDLREIYEELRLVYTAEQLDNVRLQYGNRILWQLYFDEFGYFSR